MAKMTRNRNNLNDTLTRSEALRQDQLQTAVLMVDLHKLALEGDTEGVRKFVTKSSSKVDKKNRDGQTALHCCAKGGYAGVARELLAAGAFTDVEDKLSRTPLYVAVDNNKIGVATVLCEAGASTSRPGPHGRTPLHLAAKAGLVECAKLLLVHGAPIDDSPDKYGNSPEDSCAISEIRISITTARRERAAAAAGGEDCIYSPKSASAPQAFHREYNDGRVDLDGGFNSESRQEEKHGNDGMAASNSPFNPAVVAPPSYTEAVSLSQYSGPGDHSRDGTALSPMSKAREAAKLGGDRCSACCTVQRSRQLTPCYHVVCSACARRCRNEGEDRCPTCGKEVFDDNPWIPPSV